MPPSRKNIATEGFSRNAPLKLGGTFTIVTSDNSKISKEDLRDDLLFFHLSAEYLVSGNTDLQILHYEFKDNVDIKGSSVRFSFFDNQTGITSPILVKVKGFDGSIVWSQEFKPEDRGLNSIEIKVPLQRPTVLIPLDKEALHDKTKKLRGQVLELTIKCPLKDLTVLVQAKRDGDKIWQIVGAANTDSSGNFSMPYPFGIYSEAQALVSLTPNHPAVIPITALRDGNQTISDDFLYLLVQDVDCPHIEKGEDCDCDAPKKASRLPDHADLIESDEYSQDIGGNCVNLSNPNRTLSEFNYQAIVRTSDPDVANYTLQKKVSDQKDVDTLASLSAKFAHDAQVARAARATKVTQAAQVAEAARVAHAALVARAAQVIHAAEIARAILVAKVSKTAQNAQDAQDAVDAANSAVTNNQAKYDAANAQWGSNKDPSKNNGIQQAINAAINATPGLITKVSDATNISMAANIAARGAKADLDTYDANYTQNAPQAAQDAQAVLDAQDAQDALDAQAAQDVLDAQDALDTQAALDAQAVLDTLARSVSLGTSYDLVGEAKKRLRMPVDLNYPVAWQDAPDDKKNLSIYQAVTIATGHILHYKSLFKADGYSLGELIYSLPLAPGQKKEIVVFDSSHTLSGAESQSLSQGERLAAGLISERDITDQLGGNIAEAMRGSSSANTSGISAGLGAGAIVGPVGAVLGVSGGVANSNSDASQNSSRDVSQFFGEKLRQSIMQNAESYRQLNASVVTTVQEGQRFGVTSEVVANHNHCHALTIMYFEVLRHYAIFQELSSVEECVFVPLLMTNFSTQNIYKWRDVLAQFLLPMPSETYLQPFSFMAGSGRQHPLLKAFDANERIKTEYANVDFPQGSYDDEQIQSIKGEMRLRVELPRPKTRYDRIMSLPITTKGIDPAEMAAAGVDYATNTALYATKLALTGGFLALFQQPQPPTGIKKTIQDEVLEREKIFDSFMSLDANYQSVPPAQCIRITNFSPPPRISVSLGFITFTGRDVEDFFAENTNDRDQWKAYAAILGFPDVLTMLNAYFKGNLISEWDDIFYNQMAPVIFEKIVSNINVSEILTDFSSETKYKGGERLVRLNLNGHTSKKRNELHKQLKMNVNNNNIQSLQPYVTLIVEDMTMLYSTSHYNGVLFSGNVNDDLLDTTNLDIPENSEEKRNPKREDAYLVYKLIEHLNSNLEHYNKALWYSLDPDRRYMLLDGFNIQIFNEFGRPIKENEGGLRSLASVVKNDLITITGNSLVFPVAAGYKVSQSYITEKTKHDKDKKKRVTLLDHYKPLTPIEPYRISVPSKGVFAEAVQGACDACEKIETDRLQDWNRFPNTDEPTPILPINTPTPVVTDWQAAFKDFATPMINIQNAPVAPAPGVGLAGLSELLGKSGVFKDITGLDANQQNVLKTYLSNQENAKAFASMAKDMAMQNHNTQNSGQIMDSLKAAKDSGALNQADYSKLVKDHLQQQIDGGQTKQAELEQAKQANPSLTKAAVDAVNQGKDVKAEKTDTEGNTESVDIGAIQGSALALLDPSADSNTATDATVVDGVSMIPGDKALLELKLVTDPLFTDVVGFLVLLQVIPDENILDVLQKRFSNLAKTVDPKAKFTELMNEFTANNAQLTNADRILFALRFQKESILPDSSTLDQAQIKSLVKLATDKMADRAFLIARRVFNSAAAKDVMRQIFLLANEHLLYNINHVAYILATAYHESSMGGSMTEIANGVSTATVFTKDKYYFEPGPKGKKSYNGVNGNLLAGDQLKASGDITAAPDVALWNGAAYPDAQADTVKTAARACDFYRFIGRGLVQITGRDPYTYYSNKAAYGNKDFLANPEKVAEVVVAAQILVTGMMKGEFRKRKQKLSDYDTAAGFTGVAARDIVNGDTAVNGQRVNDIAVEFKNALIINPKLDESAKYV